MTSEHEREYLELLREVTERHKVFVEEYRRGELNPEVNLRVAFHSHLKHDLNRFDGIESISQTLSGWANLLCFPAAIALFIWSEWWVGLIVLIGGSCPSNSPGGPRLYRSREACRRTAKPAQK